MTRSPLAPLALALALLALAPSRALADDEVGIFNINFCKDPVGSVCGPISTQPIGREAQLRKIVERCVQTALAQTARAVGENPLLFRLDSIARLPPVSRALASSLYVANLQAQLAANITAVQQNAFRGQIDRVRGYLKAAIEHHLPTGPGTPFINRVNQGSLIAELTRVIPVDATRIQEMAQRGDPDGKLLAEVFVDPRTCGPDGLAVSAFALPIETRKYLVVCPGLLLSAWGEGRNDLYNLYNLIMVLGHEWGHHFDSKWFPLVYARYRSCLVASYSDGLSDPGPTSASIAEQLPQRVAERKVDSHLREITADYWGTQALLEYVNSIWGPLDFLGRLDLLRQAYGALCWSPDASGHPTGSYRVGVLLPNAPGVSRAMGCKAGRPVCTL